MRYPLEKYKFYKKINEDGSTKVIAVSSYAGRTVKGYAKCDPRDDFNETTGQELAAARCGEKIAAKRVLRATDKYLEAMTAVNEATAHFEKMKQYYMDAVDQHDEAAAHLVKVTAKLVDKA